MGAGRLVEPVERDLADADNRAALEGAICYGLS